MFLSARARKSGRLLVLGAFVAAAATGCDDGSTPPTTGGVTLRLDHVVGSDSLLLHSERYTNAAGNHYDVNELRYYVSDVALVRADASTVPLGDVHYRDVAVASTRDWAFTGVPNGDYTAIRFTFGLAATRNVDGGLPVTFENGLMAWPDPLGGGYHFMQLDGHYNAGASAWMAHLGRLASPAPVPVDPHFVMQLEFATNGTPSAVHVAGDRWEVPLVMDVNAWFATPNLYDFDVFGSDVMGNPTAQRDLGENGAHVFHLGAIAHASY